MDRDKKIQEPEDNMRYAEKKAVRMMNNGLNDKDDSNLLKREKKDFELLKTKESKSDTFGPLTNSETERLQNLSIKREKDKEEKAIDNMDGDKKASEKLMAGMTSPFTKIEEMELKKLGYTRALRDPSIMSSKGKEMGVQILKDILKVNKQR